MRSQTKPPRSCDLFVVARCRLLPDAQDLGGFVWLRIHDVLQLVRGGRCQTVGGRQSKPACAAAAVMTPAMTCRTRSAARSGSGCPASSQAMIASIAAVGASCAAHRAHA